MTTERQAEANRQNAQHSTGPKSTQGKAKSRRNATKHGMTAKLEAISADASESHIDRVDDWADKFNLSDTSAQYAFERLVTSSVQIETCERSLKAALAEFSDRARYAWEHDRKLEALTLAAKLSKDPTLIAFKLEGTTQGCEVKRDIWRSLAAVVEGGRDWTEDERSTALDLLGHRPEFRTVRCRTEPTSMQVQDLIEYRAGLANYEINRLKHLEEERLFELNHGTQQRAAAGDLGILSKPVQLILRYERDAWRRYRESVRILRQSPQPPEPEDDLADSDIAECAPDPKPAAKPKAAPRAQTAAPVIRNEFDLLPRSERSAAIAAMSAPLPFSVGKPQNR